MKLNHAVILSILVHLVLVLGMKVLSYEWPTQREPPKQWLEFKDTPQMPVASDKTRRVEKETRTRETSPTTVSALNQPQSRPNQQRPNLEPTPSIGQKLRSLTPSDNDVFLKSANTVSPSFKQQLQSFLPRDLEIGDVVALNTDQNLFFTFYRRMAEKVIWPWAQNVVAGFEKMKATGQLGGARRAWITTIEVVLDKNGTVVATQPMQLAGDWEIDNAPLKAFKQAKDFPNPPAEMVEEDGYIRIRYRFVVYYNPTGPGR